MRWTEQTVELIRGLEKVLGQGSLLAYLVHMTLRIVEIHRVLKPTGSFYLHCDPTASHYLKLVLDAVFCGQGGGFRNELVWQRTATKGDARNNYGTVHDIIFYYVKPPSAIMQQVFATKDEAYLGRFTLDDGDGRGAYRLAPLDSPNARPNLTYEYKGFSPPTKGWRV